MPNLNEIELTALAKEIQGLTSSLKEAAIEASDFKKKLFSEDIKPLNEGRRGNTTNDPLEITLAALGIHVPTDEEIRKRKENPDASSEIELAISLGVIAATKSINDVLDKAVITAMQPGTYESGYTNPSTNEIKRPAENYETKKDATRTFDPLYPNDPARPPTAMETAEMINIMGTKVIPGIAQVFAGPVGQAIIAVASYGYSQITKTIGDEVHKKRKAPKNTEEYLEKNKGHFEQEEKNRMEGGRDYYWNQKLHAKKDATDVKIDIDSHLNSSQGHRETEEDSENSNYGYEAGHKRNRSKAGGAKRNTGPGPLEVFEGVTGEAQKIGPPKKAFEAIFNKKNIGMMKVFDETLQGVGQNIGSFFTGLAQGNPDAFKQFLKSIVNTFITSIQAMILASKAAAGAKAIGSFGLSLIKDAPLLAAAWVALEAAKGIIQGLNKGGAVQGFGDTDTVPAMLTPGEYVIKKSVVNKFGTGFFEWINGGGLTNSLAGHYAGGGMVAGRTKPMQLELIGDVKISGKGNDLYGVIRKEQFRIKGARS